MQFSFTDKDATVAFRGELTFVDHVVFRELADRLLKTKGVPLVIDLSALEFIDSAGLGMLLIVRDEAKEANRDLTLRKPRGAVERLFAVTKFDTLFNIES